MNKSREFDGVWLADKCGILGLRYKDGTITLTGDSHCHVLTDAEREDLQGFIARALELRADKKELR